MELQVPTIRLKQEKKADAQKRSLKKVAEELRGSKLGQIFRGTMLGLRLRVVSESTGEL